MRTFLLLLVLAIAAVLAAFLYQQLSVEGELGPTAMLAIAGLGGALPVSAGLWFLAGTRHREVVAKVLLAGGSTVASYLVLDLVAGWFLIRPLSPPLVPDEYRHHKMVPNSHAEFRQQDFAYVQRVNALGLRGADVAVEKPAGTVRVLMLGDSFTMGKGVEDDETFSFLVGRALADSIAACGGPRVEVINAGIDSYAPVLSLIHLKRELIRLSPDVVVENLDVSDLVQEAAYRAEGVRGPDGEVVAVPQRNYRESVVDRVRTWVEHHLFFTRVLLYKLNHAAGYRTVSVRSVVMEADREVVAHTLEGDVDRTAQWDDQFDSLRRLRAFADSNGIGFLLTLYPWAHQITDSQWVPGRWTFMDRDARPSTLRRETVTARAAQLGIPLLDLFPAFEQRVGREQLYFDNDMHFTVAGHRVMAEALTADLLARYRGRWCGASTTPAR